MIGASQALKRQYPEIAIDAEVGRQQDEMVAKVNELAAAGSLRSDVILHMGSNGYIGQNSVAAVLDTLTEAGVDRIVVLNISVPRRWQDPNNAVLAEVVPRYPNAILMDWHTEVADNPDLVVDDGIHPSGPGITSTASSWRRGSPRCRRRTPRRRTRTASSTTSPSCRTPAAVPTRACPPDAIASAILRRDLRKERHKCGTELVRPLHR